MKSSANTSRNPLAPLLLGWGCFFVGLNVALPAVKLHATVFSALASCGLTTLAIALAIYGFMTSSGNRRFGYFLLACASLMLVFFALLNLAQVNPWSNHPMQWPRDDAQRDG